MTYPPPPPYEPQPPRRRLWLYLALATALLTSAVAVVGWVALGGRTTESQDVSASSPPAPPPAAAPNSEPGPVEPDGSLESAVATCEEVLGWDDELCQGVDEPLYDLAAIACESDDAGAFITMATISISMLDGGPATANRVLDHAEDICGDTYGIPIEAVRQHDW